MPESIPSSTCQNPEHESSRRRFLFQAFSGAATFFGACLRGDGQITSNSPVPRNTARGVIFVNLMGASSQLDTFDAKDGPWNPADLDLRSYGRNFVLSNLVFPNLSRITNEILLLHSVSSWELAHERGAFYLQTAHPSNPAFISESPHIGSVIGLEKSNGGPMPPFLSLNGTPSQGAKFLGGIYDPMSVGADPNGLRTIEHPHFGAQSEARFGERWALLNELDQGLRGAPYDKVMADHANYYTAARRLMYDQAIASVFRFSQDDNLRYGNSNFGRACIVARNAARANNGTVFININHGGWDMHQQLWDRRYTPNMYTHGREIDAGVGNLAADLRDSGDLSQILIVIASEFGRTPGALNLRQGRDHHRGCQTVLMMGGGVRGGRALGATDAEADRIVEPGWSAQRPIYFEDLMATIYSALGIDWTKAILDTPSGRKFEYVPYGAVGTYFPVNEVFG